MRPGWTIEPRPKWPVGGHLSPTQMAVGDLRRRSFESIATCFLVEKWGGGIITEGGHSWKQYAVYGIVVGKRQTVNF